MSSRLSLGLSIVLLTGCGVLNFASQSPGSGTGATIRLARCTEFPSALCVQSFGLGKDQLLITFYFPAAGSTEFYLKVWQGDSASNYPCTLATASPTTLYCTGALIPLGASIKIDLFTKTGRTPLAEGEFTLTDLALPTLGYGSTETPTPLPVTPTAATAYP